jgi:hypothetical protein
VPAASALWAQLPLVATDLLGLGSSGYGVLLGSLGIGAVLGALVLPSLRGRLGVEALLAVLFVLYAGALAGVALLRSELATTGVLAVAGLCWMGVLSTMNATAQQSCPAGSVPSRPAGGRQAVGAAACSPSSATDRSRISTLRTLPVTVIGNSSTTRT